MTKKNNRKLLTNEVAQLDALLQRAGEGVEQEATEMEAVLRRLSSALDGVDLELAESAVNNQFGCEMAGGARWLAV